MKENQNSNSDQERKNKSDRPQVTVLGSSILYKTDKSTVNTRFTTLYGPNSVRKKTKGEFTDGFFSYSNPNYENRPKRLDLISNRLDGVQLKINNKTTNLCDISDFGFSYARKISKFSGDYYRVKEVVASSAKKLVGQKVSASFHSEEDKSVKTVEVSGTVRNVKLIYGLLLSEAELEFKKFLYKKTIHRNNDKYNAYEKLEYLVDLVNQQIEKGHWGDALAVSVNTTILNMMLEIGATSENIDKMYESYNNRPRYIRFGAAVEDVEQARTLQDFTQSITEVYRKKIEAERKAREEVANANKKARKPVYDFPQVKVDINFNFQKFLLKCWYGCLARFGLDPATESLKSNNHKLAKHLKMEARAFNDLLDQLPEKKPNQMNLKATELLINECILRGLDNQGSEEFEDIAADIDVIVRRTFEICIRELVAKLES